MQTNEEKNKNVIIYIYCSLTFESLYIWRLQLKVGHNRQNLICYKQWKKIKRKEKTHVKFRTMKTKGRPTGLNYQF